MIIIDAYNLLKQIIKSSVASERERSAFIDDIILYAKKKNSEIVLVFDGGSFPRPEQFTRSGIKIVYAGYHQSADDYIKEYIIKHHRQHIILVSSDRALYTTASRYRVTTIDSLAFYDLMQEEFVKKPKLAVKKSNEKAIKLQDDVNAELDALMYASDYVLLKDETAANATVKSIGISKEEKKLLRIVKKL